LLITDAGPSEILAVLDSIGWRVRGRPRLEMQLRPSKLRGAVSLLLCAIGRGDAIACHAAWLTAMWKKATPQEMAASILKVVEGRWNQRR